jgi:hypothetical protein
MNPGEIWIDTHGSLCVIRGDSVQDASGPVDSNLRTLQELGFTMVDYAPLRDWDDAYSSKFWVLKVSPDENNQLDSPKYVDCANLLRSTKNAFVTKVGHVAASVLEEIAETELRFGRYVATNMTQRRFKPRDVDKYDYDIALSFAGEDRQIVSELASRLLNAGVRVFYDEFEKTQLWGKDLVQHLDEVYRNKARYCAIFVSEHYASKIWTNHELKSALARSIVQNDEYILPIKLDSTELPGLRPTVGYVSLKSPGSTDAVADMLIDKLDNRNLITYAEFSSKWVENILNISRMWSLDCLAFCVDNRYVGCDGVEYRLGISYGINTTSPRFGFLAPDEQEGRNVFGIHCIGIKDGYKLCLLDRWYTSRPAGDYDRLEDAVKAAFETLAEISDEDYDRWVRFSDTTGTLARSEKYLLDEFEISIEMG